MIGGPADIVIEYERSGSPGDFIDITQHVEEFNGISIEAMLEEVRSFGMDWDKHLPIGVGKIAPVELGGLLDDSVDGPDDLFGDRIPEPPSTDPRALRVTWFGTKTTTVDTHLGKYERPPDKNGITKYKVMLQPTGAPTEA